MGRVRFIAAALAVAVAAVLLGREVLEAPGSGAGTEAQSAGSLEGRSTGATSSPLAGRKPPRPRDKRGKLESSLVATAREGGEHGSRAALAEARRQDVEVADRKVRVMIEARGDRSEARAAVAAAGGRVEEEYGELVQALVSPSALGGVAGDGDVAYVRPPAKPVPEAVPGEGVAATGANAWQARELNGAGVKVAIVDSGFDGLAESQARGDLPASVSPVDACSGEFATATDHGTGVAEIVHELAPGAHLYLVCVGTEAELGAATDYLIGQGVPIVNHSISWFNTGRGDGTSQPGQPDAIVARTRANGILWVNSAGNRAEKHWSGVFSDTDLPTDNVHNFSPSDEGNRFSVSRGNRGCAALKWDDWPASAQDFDLYLVRSSDGTPVAGSENEQSGVQEPTEEVCYENLGSTQEEVEAVIRWYSPTDSPPPTTPPRFDLFVMAGGDLEHRVAAGSLTEPASSPNTLAAGAICWQNNALEPYSSQGPTVDGRTKPDIAGQDSVSSGVYGPFSTCGGAPGFAGTSASAPHTAGAAALAKQVNPSLGAAGLQSFLEGRARDLGAAGKDNLFGSGKLLAGPPPPRCSDLRDDDRDGRVDFPADPGCESVSDDSESPDPPPPAPPSAQTPLPVKPGKCAKLKGKKRAACIRKRCGKKKGKKKRACVKAVTRKR